MNFETELKYTLGIKDPNVIFDDNIKSHKTIKLNGKITNFWYLKLTYREYQKSCVNKNY